MLAIQYQSNYRVIYSVPLPAGGEMLTLDEAKALAYAKEHGLAVWRSEYHYCAGSGRVAADFRARGEVGHAR